MKRAAAAGLFWPLPEGLDEDELIQRVYPPPLRRDDAPPAPDWPALHAELSKKGVTLMLLWQEYKTATPNGYQYSRFCDLYRGWAATQDVVLRQGPCAGRQTVCRLRRSDGRHHRPAHRRGPRRADLRRRAGPFGLHLRRGDLDAGGGFTTTPAHRPERHRAVVDLTHERLLKQAEAIGPATAGVIRAQALARKHSEYALRAGLGVLRLARDFSPEKLEAACSRALALKSTSYRAVRALIQAPEQTELSLSLPAHSNVRGPSYYH